MQNLSSKLDKILFVLLKFILVITGYQNSRTDFVIILFCFLELMIRQFIENITNRNKKFYLVSGYVPPIIKGKY